MFVDSLQEKMHKKYDLIPKKNDTRLDSQPHPKNLPSNQYKDKDKEVEDTGNKIDTPEQVKGGIE